MIAADLRAYFGRVDTWTNNVRIAEEAERNGRRAFFSLETCVATLCECVAKYREQLEGK